MISSEHIKRLIADPESDCIERTMSTSNTDKFAEAICAFANDLPNHKTPGYLILGVEDNGNVKGIRVTDELLKNVTAIRTDGNIQPQPSMTVEKVDVDGKSVVVVEVQPADYPPVRYKGRVWVRIGPRRSIANEADERILLEKRNANTASFDASPCLGTTIDDLDTRSFRFGYLPMAYDDDYIMSDKRNVKIQMQSLGFYDMRFDCPTYAGIVMFGKEVERILPGAYIQYVKFRGRSRASDIDNEYKFAGNLFSLLPRLDTFIETAISGKRPVPVSALREEKASDYPHWAIREILMNACCHRAYDSNGPIQFYQYEDRIEVLNHGGLYGRANAQNFPYVNDYRNAVIAEAMKVMGYVNRFSRGVLRMEEELKNNGNGKPTFNLNLNTAFLVAVNKSRQSIELEENAKQNLGWTPEPTPRWEWNEKAGSWDVKSDSSSRKSDSSREKSDSLSQESDSLREKSYSLMDETTASIIAFCSTPRTLSEIMSEFDFKERHNFKKKYIDPLLYVFLKQTEPDKPTSPKQKYVTIKKEEKQ